MIHCRKGSKTGVMMHFSPLESMGKPLEKKDLKVFLLALLTGLILFGLDQFTKYCVVCKIPFHARIPVIDGFFDLTYITNTGAAWGILAGRMWLLLVISGLVFAGAIAFMKVLTEGWPERYFAIFLVLSGILGNSLDRISRGAVVDFLSFYIGKYAWPSFNVADICICCGAFLYMLSSLLRPEHRKDPDSASYVQYKK